MSNLTALTLANFKAFKDEQQIPIRPITLLYGQNSAGKSSIIDALLLMHHFATDGIPDQRSKGVFFDQVSFDFTVTGSPVRLGDVDEFVHGKDLANNIQLGCTWGHGENATRMEFGFDSEGLASFVQGHGDGPWLYRLASPVERSLIPYYDQDFGNVEINREHPLFGKAISEAILEAKTVLRDYRVKNPDADATKALPQGLTEDALETTDFREHIGSIVSSEYAKLRLGLASFPPQPIAPLFHPNLMETEIREDLLPRIGHDTTIEESFGSYLDTCVGKLTSDCALAQLEGTRFIDRMRISFALKNIAYCGPQRESIDLDTLFPPRSQEGDFSIGGGANVNIRGWVLDDPAVSYVNRWLEARQAGSAQFAIKTREIEISEAQTALKVDLVDVKRDIPVGLHEVGSGIGQVVPVLLAAAAYRDHLICIKQPELHLHPALQADLADAFVRFAGRANRDKGEGSNTAFLIETHSEHLLLRLMRRIRESTKGQLGEGEVPLRPKDVAVLYVENLGTHSIVREMPLNEHGELVRDWPGGFFEEGLREVLQ